MVKSLPIKLCRLSATIQLYFVFICGARELVAWNIKISKLDSFRMHNRDLGASSVSVESWKSGQRHQRRWVDEPERTKLNTFKLSWLSEGLCRIDVDCERATWELKVLRRDLRDYFKEWNKWEIIDLLIASWFLSTHLILIEHIS